MPSASVRTAAIANAGVRARPRIAIRMSWRSESNGYSATRLLGYSATRLLGTDTSDRLSPSVIPSEARDLHFTTPLASTLRLQSLELGAHCMGLRFESRVRVSTQGEILVVTPNGELAIAGKPCETTLL